MAASQDSSADEWCIEIQAFWECLEFKSWKDQVANGLCDNDASVHDQECYYKQDQSQLFRRNTMQLLIITRLETVLQVEQSDFIMKTRRQEEFGRFVC